MFVRNRTGLPVTLARGHVTDDFAVGSINLESAFAIGEHHLDPVPLPVRTDTDPPDAGRYPLWDGVSVTAHGVVPGPSAAPYVTAVVLAVGAVEERLAVFGPRRWTKVFPSGALRPSAPEPFTHLVMTWEHAFGGAVVVPPGIVPGTDLPHPGGRASYPLNEQGMGFYLDESGATGQPLPRIERADGLLERWSDRPEPGGLASCPQLGALRLSHQAMSMRAPAPAPATPPQAAPLDVGVALCLLHHAPPRLIFREKETLTPVSLHGFSGGPIRFDVPGSPVDVVVRTGKVGVPVRPRLRSIHVDSERRLVRVTHGHMFRYAPDEAPSWIMITRTQQ